MAGSEECGDVSCGEGWPPAVELTVEHHEDLERCSGEKSALSSACRVIETWCTLQIRAKSLQSCPTWCDPIDGSPPGSPVRGILQARTLEWVAISFSSA